MRQLVTYAKRGRPQQYCVYSASGKIIIITSNRAIAEKYTNVQTPA